MFKRVHAAMVVGALGVGSLAVLACTSGTVDGASSGSSVSSVPVQQAEITSPSSGLGISATIAAATLGEECGGSSGLRAPSQGDCAPSMEGTCGGSFCQQSNVQIAFTATAGSQSANVEVVSVTLHDSATGDLVDTLTASRPQAWSGSSYAAWDQTIKPSSELKASYDLTAPKWSTITSGRTSYSTKYRLNVTLRIDGVQFVLQSSDLNREPQVAT
jgi:hypothetical protein